MSGVGRGDGESASSSGGLVGARHSASPRPVLGPRTFAPALKTRLALGRGWGRFVVIRRSSVRESACASKRGDCVGVPSPGGKALLKVGSENRLLIRSLLHLPLNCRSRGKYLRARKFRVSYTFHSDLSGLAACLGNRMSALPADSHVSSARHSRAAGDPAAASPLGPCPAQPLSPAVYSCLVSHQPCLLRKLLCKCLQRPLSARCRVREAGRSSVAPPRASLSTLRASRAPSGPLEEPASLRRQPGPCSACQPPFVTYSSNRVRVKVRYARRLFQAVLRKP